MAKMVFRNTLILCFFEDFKYILDSESLVYVLYFYNISPVSVFLRRLLEGKSFTNRIHFKEKAKYLINTL